MRKGTKLIDLMQEELQNLYTAELQIKIVLPKLATYSLNKNLKTALQEHADETKDRLSRLEKIFLELSVVPEKKTNPLIADLLNCCLDIVEEDSISVIQDVALLAFVQKLQLHQIATYDAVYSYAMSLECEMASELLQEALEGEIEKGNNYNDLSIRGMADEMLQPI